MAGGNTGSSGGATDAAAIAAAASTAATNAVASLKKADPFITTPYAGDINPGTSNGIKLYQAATADRDEDSKLTLKITTSKEFIDAMKDDATKFCWGILTAQIKVPPGGASTFSVLKDFQELTITKVRKFMGRTYFSKNTNLADDYFDNDMFDIDPETNDADKRVFYARVRSNMIAQRILGSLTKNSLKNIRAKKKYYTWTASNGETYLDGVTMLQICITIIRPTTRVGVSSVKDAIRDCKLSSFSHNVADMLDHISSLLEQIEDQGGTHDDIVYDTFAALLTTKNDTYRNFVAGLKDDWDTGTEDFDLDSLSARALAKYNNMAKDKSWSTSSEKDSKIVALTTKVEMLQEQINKNKDSSSGAPPSGGGKALRVAEWRLTNNLGPSVKRDGKEWHWCPHQHNNGKGMYVTHKPGDHVDWQENKRRKKQQAGDNDKNGNSDDKKKMTLSENMKAAMVTKFKCSPADADSIWKSVYGDSQGN